MAILEGWRKVIDYNVLQHFQPEEEIFIEQVRDWQYQVQDQYVPVLTPFLNPREQRILMQIIGNNSECLYQFNGGFECSESKRALLYPAYYIPRLADFELTVIQFNFAKKFHQLSHRHILGTILGMGIERNRLGDIITNGEDWQFVIDKALADFLPLQLTKVGSVPVKLDHITDSSHMIVPQNNWLAKEVSISSFRLDSFISEATAASRQKSKNTIESGLVKRNWLPVTKTKQQIEIGDIISVRHFGRIRFDELITETRKGKFRISISILRSK